MNKFFKIGGLWVGTFLITLILFIGFAHLGIGWLAITVLASVVGYVYLLGSWFVFCVLEGVQLNTVVFGSALAHLVVSNTLGQSDWRLVIGGLVGIVICYCLIKYSGGIWNSSRLTTES